MNNLKLLQKENLNLQKKINSLENKQKYYETWLNNVKKTKSFKLWQAFNKIKKLVLVPFRFLYYFLISFTFFIKYELKNVFVKKIKLTYLEEQFQLNGLSFIIPTWNKEEMVIKCINNLLEKLKKECVNIPKEIIVVDNGSTDNTSSEIKKIKSKIPIILISLKENLGFGKAINLATEKSKYNYIYLLNNDMFPNDGFLEEIIKFAKNKIREKKPFFGLSSQIFFHDPSKRREESGKTYIKPNFGFIDVAHCVNENNLKDNSITAYPGGGSSLLNKYVFNKIGCYDYQSYTPLYCEDLDSGYVAWKIGYPSYFIANSQVIHHHRSSSKNLKIDPDFVMHKNWLVFIYKNLNSKSLIIKHIILYSILFSINKNYRQYAKLVFKNRKNILLSKLYLSKFKNRFSDKELRKFIDFELRHEF